MPLSFPNTWGIKKSWGSPSNRDEEPEDEHVYESDTGKMKCPSCKHWVHYFAFSEGRTEYGSISASGDMDYGDSECTGDFVITCPECGDEVFDSSLDRLVRYYEREYNARPRRR